MASSGLFEGGLQVSKGGGTAKYQVMLHIDVKGNGLIYVG